ncbi:MAG: DegT/DnrJ/EryC1/StrS family aminotransferase [Dehalococcoidia bacterium]
MSPREVPFARVAIDETDIAAVVETLRSGWITTGSRVAELEAEFCRISGARYGLGVNSATAALHLALLGWRIGPGDEVILPAMTFASCATVVMETGATPVLADICADDMTIDPESVERLISPRTRVIMAVHYAGQPARMAELQALAEGRNIKILEDAAHAPGALYKESPAGSLGDAAAFSLYATKNVTSGEGGVLVSDDEELIDRARMLSLHGMSRDAWKRYSATEGTWRYEVIERGYKYNLSDLLATLGVNQVRRLGELNVARTRAAGLYKRLLADVEQVEALSVRPEVTHAWHLYVVKLRLDRMRIDRARFIELLRERGVDTSVHFIPIHHHPAFKDIPADLPETDAAFERIISLPMYSGLSDEDIEYVAACVSEIARENRR